MIRYFPVADAWVSGKNPDDQGFPSTNLDGDDKLCTCVECVDAYMKGLGSNIDQIYG